MADFLATLKDVDLAWAWTMSVGGQASMGSTDDDAVYYRIGKRITGHGQCHITAASTGDGWLIFSLPVASTGSFADSPGIGWPIGTFHIVTSGGSHLTGIVITRNGASAFFQRDGKNDHLGAGNDLYRPAIGDYFTANLNYDAA